MIKVINLYEELMEKDIINDINKKYNEETDNFKKEIIKIKINSIKSDLNKKEYKEKIIIGVFSIYYYENKSVKIYTNKIENFENIMKILKENKDWYIWIIGNKKKNTYILIENIEHIDLKKLKELINITN